MIIEVLKSKIHRVKVTQSELNYVGSITIDEDLIDAANAIQGDFIFEFIFECISKINYILETINKIFTFGIFYVKFIVIHFISFSFFQDNCQL